MGSLNLGYVCHGLEVEPLMGCTNKSVGAVCQEMICGAQDFLEGTTTVKMEAPVPSLPNVASRAAVVIDVFLAPFVSKLTPHRK